MLLIPQKRSSRNASCYLANVGSPHHRRCSRAESRHAGNSHSGYGTWTGHWPDTPHCDHMGTSHWHIVEPSCWNHRNVVTANSDPPPKLTGQGGPTLRGFWALWLHFPWNMMIGKPLTSTLLTSTFVLGSGGLTSGAQGPPQTLKTIYRCP